MACVISCSKAATRWAPGVKSVPIPTEPSAPGFGTGRPKSLRDAGGDIEVRNVVDAVAGRQIGGGEEVGLAEGKQSVPQIRIRNVNRTESVGRRYREVLAEETPHAVRYRV